MQAHPRIQKEYKISGRGRVSMGSLAGSLHKLGVGKVDFYLGECDILGRKYNYAGLVPVYPGEIPTENSRSIRGNGVYIPRRIREEAGISEGGSVMLVASCGIMEYWDTGAFQESRDRASNPDALLAVCPLF